MFINSVHSIVLFSRSCSIVRDRLVRSGASNLQQMKAILSAAMPNHAFQPTYLPPLRVVKSAAEGERWAAQKREQLNV